MTGQGDELERRLADAPAKSVPTITLEGDANGAPHSEPGAYAKKFSGKYQHRQATEGIGHNLPQEARQRSLLKVMDLERLQASESEGTEPRAASPRCCAMRDAEVALLAGRLRKADVETFPIRRVARGRPLRFVNGKAKPLGSRDARRIEELVIPPAWKNVRISADPRSHIQAIGRDDVGRRQYIYHPEWEAVRSAEKARRLQRLIAALPRLRQTIARDLDRNDDRRILATAARLVDRLGLRAGHEEYAGEESGRGAATLLRKHLRISGTTLTFDFPGKGSKRIAVSLTDPKMARNLALALRLPGRRLFRLQAVRGWRNMTANDLNRYLADTAKCDVTAKDFRTLRASAMALERLLASGGQTRTERRRALVAVAKDISRFLANTPAVVRKSYIHALIIEQFESGSLPSGLRGASMRNCTKGERLLYQFITRARRLEPRAG